MSTGAGGERKILPGKLGLFSILSIVSKGRGEWRQTFAAASCTRYYSLCRVNKAFQLHDARVFRKEM